MAEKLASSVSSTTPLLSSLLGFRNSNSIKCILSRLVQFKHDAHLCVNKRNSQFKKSDSFCKILRFSDRALRMSGFMKYNTWEISELKFTPNLISTVHTIASGVNEELGTGSLCAIGMVPKSSQQGASDEAAVSAGGA